MKAIIKTKDGNKESFTYDFLENRYDKNYDETLVFILPSGDVKKYKEKDIKRVLIRGRR